MLRAGRFQTAQKEQQHMNSRKQKKQHFSYFCKKKSEGAARKQMSVRRSLTATVHRFCLTEITWGQRTHRSGIVKSLQSFTLLIKAAPQ